MRKGNNIGNLDFIKIRTPVHQKTHLESEKINLGMGERFCNMYISWTSHVQDIIPPKIKKEKKKTMQ